MDNLTHSLIGLIAGDCVARSVPESEHGISGGQRRSILLLLFIIGGNLPDIDLLLTYHGFDSDPLRYVIVHRGYTHTVVGCLVLALCLYACVEIWARWRRLALTPRDRALFGSMTLLSTFLHLGMDFLNSYGVHPFWPWYNGWVYGDSVFIIEPLYWLATAPLIATVRSVGARFLLIFVVIVGSGLTIFLHPHQLFEAVIYVLITAGLFMAGRLGTPRTAALLSAGAAALVTGLFVVEGRAAAGAVADVARSAFPGQRVLDQVLSPVPTNPYCWDMLLLTTGSGVYRASHGMVSTAPRVVPAHDCPSVPGRTAETTAPQSSVDVPAGEHDSDGVRWIGEFSISEEQLRAVAASSCETLELMQFVRAPFASRLGVDWVLGDLRFDRGGKTGMAQVVVQPPLAKARTPVKCASDAAPWLPPRGDLLR